MFEFDEPVAMTIFCDDVRNEIGGKFSYIGIYTGGMEVPAFPAALPKFAFVVNVVEPRKMAEVRDEPIRINLYLPGDDNPSIFGDLAPIKDNLLGTPVPHIPEDPGANPISVANAIFVIAPLLLQQPGRIRVRCEYPGGGLMRAGSIGVDLPRQAAEATAPSVPSPPAVPGTSSRPAPSRRARRVRQQRS